MRPSTFRPQAVAAPAVTMHTVADLLERYEKDFLPSKAPATRRQQASVFKVIDHDLGEVALKDLTPALLRQWRDDLLTRYPVESGTARRYLMCFSGPLTAAVREYEVLTENPLRKITAPPANRGRVRFLSDSERERLLTSCQHSRNPALYPLVLLALTTGARKEELRRLRWGQIDLERGMIRLEETKNGERRLLVVTGRALQVLKGWRLTDRRPEAWVFPSKKYDRHKPTLIGVAFEHAARRAGLDNFHFHDLRHTAASYLAMSGASLLDIAEILGHKQLTQTRKYTHLLQGHKAKVVGRMLEHFGLGQRPGEEMP